MFLRLLIVRPLARDAPVERPQGAFAVNILQIYVHSARVREKRDGCCASCARNGGKTPRCQHAINRSAYLRLDGANFSGTLVPSRPPRVLSRGIAIAGRDRRPAGCLASNPREASEQHRPPATTSGTCECTNAKPKGTAHVQSPGGLGRARRARSQKIAAWSAERRASPGCADGVSYLRGDARASDLALRAYVTGPLNGCFARTPAPVGAPLPCLCEGDTNKARRGDTSRERCAMRMTLENWHCVREAV